MSDAETQDKVAIVVLGMHRSGTSSLAGLLDRLGCRGPAHPMPANEWNAKGYYEPLPVFRLDDEILAAAGSNWNDWRALNPDWHLSPRFTEYRDQARQILSEEFGDASLLYIKDPRICVLLPFWRQVLSDSGYRTVFLHIHRSPAEVAASLEKRDGMEPSVAMLLWLRHVLAAESGSRGQTRLFTSYAALLRDPLAVAEAMASSFGFAWPRTMPDSDFIDAGLRHHDRGSEAVLENGRIPHLIRDALGILEAWADRGENPEDHARLDAISAEFDRASRLFSTPMRRLEAQAAQLAPARERSQALEGERLEFERRLARQTEENAALETRLAEAVAARKSADNARDEAARAAQAAAAEATETRTALEARLAEGSARQEQLAAEIDLMTDRLIDRDRLLAALRRDVLGSSRKAEDLEGQNRLLRQQLEHADAELQRRHDEIAALRRHAEAIAEDFLASTSWRISAPVRVVGRVIGRLRPGRDEPLHGREHPTSQQ